MGKMIEVSAGDGHRLDAYLAEPNAAPSGGVVILQEIFGLNAHIKSVADQYAAAGFAAVAPAMFDRVEKKVDIPYSDIPAGLAYLPKLDPRQTMLDVQAAIGAVARFGRVGVVGYCWGGTVAYLAAGVLPIEAAVSYYGGHIGKFLDRKPKAPIIYHIGEKDGHIPAEAVAAMRAALGDPTIHLYPDAGHGFNCSARPDSHETSAREAFGRSVAFLQKHLGR